MNLPQMSPEGDRVLAAATQESLELEHRYLGVEHLFLGLAREWQAELTKAFTGRGVELVRFVETLRKRVQGGGSAPLPEEMVPTPRCREVFELATRIASSAGVTRVEPAFLMEAILREGRSVPVRLMRAFDMDVASLQEPLRREPAPQPTPTPLLARYGRDLTAMAQRGQLSPVIGRNAEMDLLAQVLLRKNKNNPVLVGEAGVGKTAVVEGFAQRLLLPSCPEPFRGRRIIELSIGSLVAGTKYRGEFEERLLGIQKEVAAHTEVILFLDEIHSLVGAGATGGGDSLDASNILKPALARGELRCVGATTIEEYRQHIERDPALERRFEKILLEEPSPEDALEILTQLRASLEAHHEVEITSEALAAAVELTVQHVRDRQLPDKALDAVDQSCARKRLRRYADPAASATAGTTADPGPIRVEESDVANTVSQWTGIPLERISGEAAKHLLNLEDDLRELVIGQDEAVRAVTRTVLTAKAGLSEPDRPLGVFFFAGPTGVGKTHLAKCLAQVLFGDAKRLVRLDMSEYMEPHAVSNLIGAPPGYVGHEREGSLIAALRTHPHCIVLLDEIEKAHPKVFDLFLQVFDEGRLTGTQGKTADFTQAVVILTSNINPSPPERTPVGFQAGEQPEPEPRDPRDALLEHLRPELVNRIDAVVPFNHLGEDTLRRIIDRNIAGIEKLLEARHVRLELDDAVYAHLLELGDSATYGARELGRLVDQHIRQPLAAEILRHGDDIGLIRATLGEEGIEFHVLKDEGMMA